MSQKISLVQRDRASVWHPFTPQIQANEPIAFVSGSGACLFDETGNAYIDAIASWWVNLHGHTHPYIISAVTKQLQTLEHAIFSGFTHEPAVRLAELLMQKLNFANKVFYSDDGSTAVEVALKMAFQYWHNQDKPRYKVIAFENAYHGDTFGGMSVGARNVFSRAYDQLLFDVITIPVPVAGKENECINRLNEILATEKIAALIAEPLVQGAAGMVMYAPQALDALFDLARKHEVILIADEVMTGFGRTGTWFASDQLAVKPDIVCLSKGITGGFLPLGATLCNARIYEAYLTSDRYKTFFHGHSYTANPTACAAAIASFELLELNETQEAIKRIAAFQEAQKERLKNHPLIAHARCCGTIAAFEMRSLQKSEYLNPLADDMLAFFTAEKIILRPLGNIVYVLPPYCISNEQLEQVYAALDRFLLLRTG
ncbi:MAG: adenosylmethionine--8-amino-7-oxononanoate transaminase [Bacteroidia bacterium]